MDLSKHTNQKAAPVRNEQRHRNTFQQLPTAVATRKRKAESDENEKENVPERPCEGNKYFRNKKQELEIWPETNSTLEEIINMKRIFECTELVATDHDEENLINVMKSEYAQKKIRRMINQQNLFIQ